LSPPSFLPHFLPPPSRSRGKQIFARNSLKLFAYSPFVYAARALYTQFHALQLDFRPLV